MTDPEKEVKRPSASREPTHNVYTELPAPSQPHNSANKKLDCKPNNDDDDDDDSRSYEKLAN